MSYNYFFYLGNLKILFKNTRRLTQHLLLHILLNNLFIFQIISKLTNRLVSRVLDLASSFETAPSSPPSARANPLARGTLTGPPGMIIIRKLFVQFLKRRTTSAKTITSSKTNFSKRKSITSSSCSCQINR
jgi:hypothetical protein